MALTAKARKRLEVAMARREEATEIADAIDSVLDTNVNTAITLNVSATGSDTGDGSATKPFGTIQAAIESLAGLKIQAKVTIQVGIGSFPAFSLEGFRTALTVTTNPLSPASTTGLEITGTWVAPTLTSGTLSGTATGGLVNSTAVLTDAGQAWTVNELRGKYVLVGSVYYPIISNAATTITVPNSNSLSGAYSIWDHGTIIDSGTATAFGSGSGVARIAISCLPTPNSGDFTISNMRVSMDGLASGQSGVTVRNAFATFSSVSVVRTTGTNTSGFSVTTGSHFTSSRCYISHNDATGNGISSATAARNISTFSCYFRNGNLGITGGAGASFLSMNSTTFESVVTGLAVNSGNTAFMGPSNRFISCTTGVTVGSQFAPAWVGGTGTSAPYFNGCGTCISVTNQGVGYLDQCIGTGNTNGIVLTKGARCQIGSTATLGATNELSVDGVAGTLVTLRAASPRVFPLVPNPYGTYVYE
jgi:hypothetical protein